MCDTGPGYKVNKKQKGIGLMLIDILIEQIEGEKTIKNSPEGLEYKINFKLK